MKAQETNMSINDIIFENRNKSYGAYSIRKIYGNHIFKALTISVLSFSFILTFPIIYKKYFAEEVKEKTFELVEVKLEEINIEHPELPPPPVSIDVPPPQISMVKFLPPEVKPDNEIKEDEDPPTDEQLRDSNPGDKTQDGEKLNTVVESGTGTGTGPVAPKIEEKPVQIVTWVPEMPQFPGGPGEYLNFLKKHIRYPSRAIEEGIEGTLKVSFVVNVDGTLSDIKIINSLGHGLDEEAIRVFKKMPPWKPGRQNSTATPVRLIYPVAFDIAEE